MTIWVDETIDQIRLHPDEIPFKFKIQQLVVLTLEPPVYDAATRLDFTQASTDAYLCGLWHGPDPGWRWSGPEAAVEFRLERVEPLRLRMMANTFGAQRIVVSLNGQQVKTLDGNGGDLELIEVDLPPEAIAGSNTLRLRLPDARSPQNVAKGEDSRILGIVFSDGVCPSHEGTMIS
jgi:hypothetical protein